MMTDSSQQPRQRAIALHYEDHTASAPRVVAKGIGEVAQKIMSTASANGVPIQTDEDLVELLSQCPMGAEIPEELYSVVAELLTWLYGINGNLRS